MKPERKLFKNCQIIIAGHKPCAKCQEVKLLTEFNHMAKASSKLQSYCRVCNGEIDRSEIVRKPHEKAVTSTEVTVPEVQVLETTVVEDTQVPILFNDKENEKELNSIPDPSKFFNGQHIIKRLSGEWKLCPHCKKTLSITEFDYGPENETTLLKSWCRKCLPKKRTAEDITNDIVICEENLNKLIKELYNVVVKKRV